MHVVAPTRSARPALAAVVVGLGWMALAPDRPEESTVSRTTPPRARPRVPRSTHSTTAPNDDPPAPLTDQASDDLAEARVVDESGIPVAGVTVELVVEGEPVRVTRTDGDGRFDFGGDLPREVEVRITGPHHTPVTRRLRTRTSEDRTAPPPPEIPLGSDRHVVFRLTDGTGAVPPDARILVRRLDEEEFREFPADGSGRVAWLPPAFGSEFVLGAARRYATCHVTGWRAGSEHDVYLEPGHVVAGRVVDSDGDAVRDVVVRLDSALGLTTRTDRQGRFRLTGVPPSRTVGLSVDGPGRPRTTLLTATGREDVEIRLRPKQRPVEIEVRVRVLLPNGSRAPDAICVGDDLRGNWGRFSGSFTVSDAEDARVFGFAASPRTVPGLDHVWYDLRGNARIDLVEGRTSYSTTARLEPQPISFLPVRVTHPGGRPVTGFPLRSEGARPTSTDDEGRATLVYELQEPGSVRVRSPSDPSVLLVTRSREDHADAPDRIVVDTSPPLWVHVDGVPSTDTAALHWFPESQVAGRWQAVEPMPPSTGEEPDLVRRFQVGVVPDQPLWLVLRTSKSVVRWYRVEQPAKFKGRVRLHVDDVEEALVHVVGPQGEPRLGGRPLPTIRLGDGTSRQQVGSPVYEDPGWWRLPALPAAELELLIVRNRRLVGIAKLDPRSGGSRATVKVPPLKRVAGRVRGTDGKPLGGCDVHLLIPGGHLPTEPMSYLGTTGEDGRFEVDVPEIDEAHLAVTRADKAMTVRPVSDVLDTGSFDVRLRAGGGVRMPRGHRVERAILHGTDVSFEPRLVPSDAPADLELLLPLPAGRVDLVVHTPGDGVRRVSVDVRSGELVDLPLWN